MARNSNQRTARSLMETNSYRALIFPPIVLAILAGMFQLFEVFDVLLDRDKRVEHIAMATHVPATPPAATRSVTPTRAAGSSSAMPQPFSSSPVNNPAPTFGESVMTPVKTNWPPQLPVNVAATLANLPSAAPNPTESGDPENTGPPDEPETSVPPDEGNVPYQAPVNATGELVANAEVPQPEIGQPLGQEPVVEEPVINEPTIDEQEPPQ
jgi:hypothetical protein